MLKLSLLKPFTFYRSKTQVIVPVDMRRPKMNSLYAVLAPDVYQGLGWVSDTDNMLRFRHIYRYFIEKYTNQKLYGTSQIRHDYGSELKISEYLEELKSEPSQLKNALFVSYRSGYKGDMLKKYNVYYEINHIVQAILNNPRDKRLIGRKMDDIVSALTVALHGNLKLYNMDAYYNRYIFIPVNLWFTEGSYNDLSIYRKTTKNMFGALINAISSMNNFKNLFDGYKVVLVNHNELMILDPAAIPEKAKETYILESVKLFMRRCKSTEDNLETEPDNEEDAAALNQLEAESKKEDTTSKIIQNVIPDNVPVSSDTVKEIEKAVVDVATARAAKKTPATAPVPRQSTVEAEPEPAPTIADARAAAKLQAAARREKKIQEMQPEELEDVDDSYETEDETYPEPEFDDEMGDPTVDKSPNDVIVQARLSGQSIGNYQRNEMLKKRYSELRIDNRPITDVIKSEKKYIIPDKKIKAKTINPAYKDVKSQNFEKAYNDQLFMHDLARILIHFANANPALYLLNDPIIEDISTDIDKLYMVTVEYEDENRKRHKFKFKLPKMYQDKYLFLNEQKWNIIHQKTPFPVTKMGPSEVQVVTNYNKIIMERYGLNISSRITKLKKILGGAECPFGIKPTRGNTNQLNKNYLTTIEYDELGSKFDKLGIGDLMIYFVVDDAKVVIPKIPTKIPDPNIIPIAADRKHKKYYFLSGTTNIVYDQDGNNLDELSNWIINEITKIHPDFEDQFAGTSAGTKFTYTRGRIMEKFIPLIIILAAADPGGLVAVLDKAKIEYNFSTTRPKGLNQDEYGIYAFSDGYLTFKRYPYENSLLLNGLSVIPAKTYSWYDMGNRDTYVELFDLLYDSRKLIDGIENFYYLEIDPITEDVLKHLGMPTEFTRLLLYANGVLADNSVDADSDYHKARLRSNEVVLVELYKILCRSYATYRRTGEKFSMRVDELVKALLQSRIVESHSKLNLALELENDRQVKLKGPSGMNQDRSFTLEKRAYHPSMKGIIGMNSTPSGEVGINRHMSLNSNIIDARGFVQVDKDDYDGTELETPGELLNPFDAESADPERVAMAISQSKHYVPTQKVAPALVNYDMERVAPYLSNDYAYSSKKSGVVKEISDQVMILQYDDGTFDDIDLSEHPDKNTDGGFFIMNQLVTDLKEGDRFDSDEILAYNPKYITGKDDFNDNLAATGTLARVAIVMNGAVYEDACYLTDKLCEDLSTKITTDKTVHLSRFSNIRYIVKKGQQVQANDPLLLFDDTDDEFSSKLIQQMAEQSEDSDEISATSAPVFSKVTGVVKDIKIYYTCDPELMTPSLRKIITDYNKEVQRRHAVIEKYMDPKDSNSIIPPCTMVTPDSTGRVKGKKMPKEVMIEFYIEYTDKLGTGDKITNFYALKGVASYIIPKGQEAFTEFNPERKIDAYLSGFGLFKRMVLSLEKEGGLTKILIEKKRLLKNKYLDRINEELKK